MKTKSDKQMKQFIKPYAKKIRRHRCLLFTIKGACIGIILAVLLCILSFLIPIEYAFLWSLGLIVLGSLMGYLFSVIFPENIDRIVRKVDEFGFEERIQTMWELHDSDSEFAILQRMDAIQKLQAQKIPAKKPLIIPKKYLWIFCGGFLFMVLCQLIPNSQKAILSKRRADQATMREQAELVDSVVEQLNKNNTMDQAVKQELNAELQNLAANLRKEKDLTEGIKQLSQTQKTIEELRQESLTENQKLSDELKQKDETRSLGNYLQDGNNEALRQWEKQIDDQAQTQQTADALREAAQEIEDQKAKDELEAMADALEAGEKEKAKELSNQLRNTMNSAADNNSNTSNATFGQLGDQLNIAKSRMTQSTKKSSDMESRSSQNNKNDQNNSANSASSSGQSKNNQGKSSGEGSGGQSQQGKSSGDGDGKGQGSSGNGKGGKGAGRGSGALKDFEKIYDATRLGGESEIDQIEGQIDENAESMQGAVDGIGNFDGYVPYDEVVGEYGEQAVQGAQRENLPPAAQEWVQGYFESLQ